MKCSRLFALFVGFLGLLGTTACVAAIIVVWSMGSQILQTNNNVFDGIDNSLAAIRDRVLATQRRVQESKITTKDIWQSVGNWTGKEASERLASRLEIEEKADQLALGLQQADLWLDTSVASIQHVQQALDMGSSLGAPVDAKLIDPLLEQVGTSRRQLTQITQTVDGIRERITRTANGKGLAERTDSDEVAQLLQRVVVTIGVLDSRLGESADRFADAQTQVQHLRSRTHTFIATMVICAVVFIAWMMVGQVSLFRHGW